MTSFANNYLALRFMPDYAKANDDHSNYYPDFIVKLSKGTVVIAETKGLVDADVPQKFKGWPSESPISIPCKPT